MAKKNTDEDFDFELDADDMIDEYESEVNLMLTVLGEIDSDLAHSVVTNGSKFSDFDLTAEETDEVVSELGFAIKHTDNIVDIAKKMRDNA